MASARTTNPAQQVAQATQQILQVSITVLWNKTDETGQGLGPIITLERELSVSGHFAKQIIDSLEFLGYLTWDHKRGMGALYYVPATIPRIPLAAVRRLLKEYGTPSVRLLEAV